MVGLVILSQLVDFVAKVTWPTGLPAPPARLIPLVAAAGAGILLPFPITLTITKRWPLVCTSARHAQAPSQEPIAPAPTALPPLPPAPPPLRQRNTLDGCRGDRAGSRRK